MLVYKLGKILGDKTVDGCLIEMALHVGCMTSLARNTSSELDCLANPCAKLNAVFLLIIPEASRDGGRVSTRPASSQ